MVAMFVGCADDTRAGGGSGAGAAGAGGQALSGGAGPAGGSSVGGGGATASGGAGSGGTIVVGPSTFDIEDLDHHRNRLLDTLAQRRGEPDRCSLWNVMTTVEKGLFLTHSDMLGHRSCFDNESVPAEQLNGGTCAASECTCSTGDPCRCLPGSAQAIDHVFKIWAINGTDLGCCTGTDCCNGGAEWHRTFFSADDTLIAGLRDVHAALPEWADSNDFAGPHDPFTQSDETQRGSPRGQAHFWSLDGEASTLDRIGVEGVLDAHIVELDNDYNILHDSSSEGTYSSQYGRAKFKENWNGSGADNRGDGLATTFLGNGAPPDISEIANDAIWSPACGPTIDPGGVVPSGGGTADELELGANLTISGSGFASAGNRVFVRTRSMAVLIDASSPLLLSESATTVELQLPLDVGTGEGFVYVASDGVLSNAQPVTIGP